MESSPKNPFSTDAMLGRILQGNYRLDKQVGIGGMAWVFRSTHVKLDEIMAVKILLPHVAQEEEVRVRFINEARIQFKLKHPNIVQVTDIIETNDLIGIVMEWVNGENLKQFLKRVGLPLPLRDVWWLMAPVLDAVGYAHRKQLVHRDLKPPNIMLHLDEEQNQIVPKVADFGIAKLLDDADSHTQTGMVMGTVKYMSPEQMHDSKAVDNRSDIYSLGVMLYLMATGRLPFSGKNEMVIYKTLHELPPRPSTINPKLPPAFDTLIEKCLAKLPEQRYANCAEVSHALSLALLSTSGQFDTDSTQQLSPIQVQQMLRDLPDTEPSNIYISSIYNSPLGQQISHNLADLADQPSGSGSSRPQPPRVIAHHQQLPTGIEVGKKQKEKKPKGTNPGLADNGSHSGMRSMAEPLPSKSMKAPIGQSDHYDAATEFTDGASMRKLAGEAQPPSNKKIIVYAVIASVLLAFGGAYLLSRFASVKPPKRTPPPRLVATKTINPLQRLLKQPAEGCTDGSTRPCFTGNAGCTKQNGRYNCKGACKTGTQTCTGGAYGLCVGQILAKSKEVCNGADDDCNGKVDESFDKAGQPCSKMLGSCNYMGVWRCTSKGPLCQTNGKFKDPDAPRAQLKIYPKNAAIKLRIGSKTKRFKHAYCIELKKKRVWVKIQARRYHTCAIHLRARKKSITLRLKKKGGLLDITPPPTYCLR